MTLTSDGRVTVKMAGHEMGMGTVTTHTMVTADRLGLAMQRVTVEYGDSHFTGVVLAGGSQQTASIGAAVTAAHHALIRELLKLAGEGSVLSGLDADQVIGSCALWP